MPQLRAFYAKVLTTWGFVVRHRGVSAAQPAYLVPPPPTIVGAFGYPLIRALGSPQKGGGKIKWGEGILISEAMEPLLEATVVACGGFVSPAIDISDHASRKRSVRTGLAVYQESVRIIAVPYRTGGQMSNVRRAVPGTSLFFENAIPLVLPVQALGATYAPHIKLELLWVVDIEKLSKEFDVSVDKLDNTAQKAVYGVVRIGSKESLVVVEGAKYVREIKIYEPGMKIQTRLYVPKTCAELYAGSASELIIPDLEYRLSYFYLPAEIASNNLVIPLPEGYPPPTFKILDRCKAYSIDIGVTGIGVIHER
jgi:CRISPR-associated protein Cas5a/b/c